jgi:zinc transport system permease protein
MLKYAFMQNAFAISFFIAILCPAIGVFLVVRRYALIGDTLSHASLAGVTLGLLAGGNPIIGAFAFTAFAGALIEFLRSVLRKYADLILSVVLSLSVGIAITGMSSGRLHANAEAYMFGSVLTVTRADLVTVSVLSVLSVAALLAFYHQMLYISFDEETARIAGVRVRFINYVFSILVAATISVSIKIVGMLVLSSMLALPVATALQFGKGFRKTLVLSIVFSVVDIMLGLILSWSLNVAPGGFTALVAVGVLAIVIAARKSLSLIAQRPLVAPTSPAPDRFMES